ncbi:hypothetical protein [Streptomyces sp. HNM0574]|uniref:hypothetical protein n=1 Tax=Streptomyces sp. HNM0574 TaxID=2714954 RepID=UPI00146EADCA|nr:hypothetical protein [Streptomyces sp. HNM0574]NLU70542.1 hypothetical protein [Streptomyces sp. HNM0574]
MGDTGMTDTTDSPDDDRPREAPRVTNLINGEVSHSVVIQAGSVEGEVHVHAPPGQSAEHAAALGELEERVAARERAEREERERHERERDEAERRRRQEQLRRRRNRDLQAMVEAEEERAETTRKVLTGVSLALAVVVLAVGMLSRSIWVVYLGLFVAGAGGLAARLPNAALQGGRRETQADAALSRRAASEADRDRGWSQLPGRSSWF